MRNFTEKDKAALSHDKYQEVKRGERDQSKKKSKEIGLR